MRIVVISTTIMTCPPPGYSGLEQLAYQQAEGLARKGHQVMLVAPHGSTINGFELHGTTVGESEMQAYSGYAHKLKDWDIIIDSSWQKWAYIGKLNGQFKGPVLGVCHAPINTMYNSAPPVPLPCIVTISNDQASHARECWGVATRTAYNGVDLDFYRPDSNVKRNDRYLFLARFSKIKGAHIAIDVARKLRIGLDLVGDDRITGEPEYCQRIMAQAKNNIRYVGPQSRGECSVWFRLNRALLHPVEHFREPFGLAPVESMASGMPVIAWDNGAMKETIRNGETGFLVKSQDEMENLIKTDAVAQIKSERCIEWASQFSIKNMINRYEELCKEAIDTGGW